MLPFDNVFGDPVLEALEVNVLDSSHASAETDQRVGGQTFRFEANPAKFLVVASLAVIRYALDLQQIIVHAVGLDIPLGHLLLLLNDLLESQFDFAQLDVSTVLQRVEFCGFEYPPETLVVVVGGLEVDHLVVDCEGVEEAIEVGLLVVEEVLAIVGDEAVGGYLLVGDQFVVLGVEVEQLQGLRFPRLYLYENLSGMTPLTHL